MSGHSRWANIKRTKGAADAKRGRTFTKLVKEITVAARIGGSDPKGNPRLRLAIEKAKAEAMPKDNIDRAIKKGTGELEGEAYQEIVYEGYGPHGVALIIETTTDNKNRTVSEIRNILDKANGSMGQSNSVAWKFARKGRISVPKKSIVEDKLMEAALDSGGEDVQDGGDVYFVLTAPDEFIAVKDKLEAAKITIAAAELTYVATNTVKLSGKDAESVLRLLDTLDEHDDVQNVHSDVEIDDAEMARIAGA
jgi:YebC/PmpR family DNA-binding regulatory protein